MLRKTKILILLFIPLCLWAQRNELLSESIKTLTVQRNGKWNTLPYLELGTRDYLSITFDDLTHEYHRYRYRVEPMNWNWTPNERLLSSEFLARGIGDEPIEEFEESINTATLYTHYSFRFPNAETAIKISGNYRLVIYDDDEEEDIAIIPFCVLENNSTISVQVETNTDIDFNKNHQQLTYTLQPSASLNVHYPETELHTIVMQNLSPLTTVYDPKPDFATQNGLQWLHAKELIFPAGNEFQKFEMTTVRYGGMGMDRMQWFDPYYHATLLTDKPQHNYIYDEDSNGAFVIKTIDRDDKNIEAEYVIVHFSLKTETILDGDIYIDGAFTNHALSPEFLMTYNPESKCYEGTVLMKQGHYNYQYLYKPRGTNAVSLQEIQGNFYQTENRYTILAYYSQRGSRYDRLIGISDFQFMSSRK